MRVVRLTPPVNKLPLEIIQHILAYATADLAVSSRQEMLLSFAQVREPWQAAARLALNRDVSVASHRRAFSLQMKLVGLGPQGRAEFGERVQSVRGRGEQGKEWDLTVTIELSLLSNARKLDLSHVRLDAKTLLSPSLPSKPSHPCYIAYTTKHTTDTSIRASRSEGAPARLG